MSFWRSGKKTRGYGLRPRSSAYLTRRCETTEGNVVPGLSKVRGKFKEEGGKTKKSIKMKRKGTASQPEPSEGKKLEPGGEKRSQ